MTMRHGRSRPNWRDTIASAPGGNAGFWILIGFLFVFGLGLPVISQALVYVVVFWLLLFWRGKVMMDFAVQLLLLAMFGLTYYLILYQYGFIALGDAIHRPLYFLGCYAIGYSIKKNGTPNWPNGLAMPILAPVVGLLIWMFLLLFSATPHQIFEARITRSIGGFWPYGGARPLVATAIGLYASLGICLLPILLLLPLRLLKKYQAVLLWLIVIVMAVVAFYATTIFQDRAPLMTACFSFVTCSGIYFFGLKNIDSTGKKFAKSIMIAMLFGSAVYIMINYVNVSYIFERFSHQGAGSSRYAAWLNFIYSFPDHLMGGRTANINGLEFANNLWLDVAYDSGIIPLVLLLVFHVTNFYSVVMVAKSKLPVLIRMIVAAIACAFLVGFIFEPVLSSSVLEFGLSCLFFGIVRRLHHEYKCHRQLILPGASRNARPHANPYNINIPV